MRQIPRAYPVRPTDAHCASHTPARGRHLPHRYHLPRLRAHTPTRGRHPSTRATSATPMSPHPHTGKTSHTPIQRLKPRRISRRAVGARRSRSRGRPRLRPSRRRKRPAPDGVLSAMSMPGPHPARRRVSGAPRARDALGERRVRSPRTGRLGGGGPGRLRRQRLPSPADAPPRPTPRSCATTSWARPPCPVPKGQTAADTTTWYHHGSIHLLELGAAS